MSYGGFLAAPVLPTYPLKSELPSALVLPGWRTMDVCRINCNAVLVRLRATADGQWVGGGSTGE